MKRILIILSLILLPYAMQGQNTDWGYFPLGGASVTDTAAYSFLDEIFSRAGGTGITTSVLADSGDANYVRAEVDPAATPIANSAKDSATLANQRADVLEAEADTIGSAERAQIESDLDGTITVANAALPALTLPDTLKKWPYGLTAPGTLGYVWGTLPGGAQGWRADSAGGAADTAQFVSMNRDDTKYGNLSIMGGLSIGKDTVRDKELGMTAGSSIRFTGGYAPSGDIRLTESTGGLTIEATSVPAKFRLLPFGNDIFFQNTLDGGGTTFTGAAGNAQTGNVVFKGTAASMIAFGDIVPRFKVDVAGRIRSSDTLRVGDYTTYSYFIPGGALVSSSTAEIKRNISDVPTPVGLFANFLQVNPKRYRFKPEAFRTLTLANVSDTLTATERDALIKEDSLKALQIAERWQVGLLAEEFNAMLGRAEDKEINQAEVSAVLWKVLQETLRAGNALRQEVDTLKAQVATLQTQMAQGQSAIQNLVQRVTALENP